MSSEQLPLTERRDDPTRDEFVSKGVSISVSRQRCVDAMGPDEAGKSEFRYEYDLFEFCLGEAKLHGRAYTDEPNEAHFLAMEVRGKRDLLTPADLEGALAQAAIRYLRRAGRPNLSWLDSGNTSRGYSSIP